MENLNKENFFNEVEALCPMAMEYFKRWIDEYKKEVGWSALFGESQSQLKPKNGIKVGRIAPKFHDLPFEMQNGIIARFELELFNNRKGAGQAAAEDIQKQYRGQIRSLFLDLEKQIHIRAIKLN